MVASVGLRGITVGVGGFLVRDDELLVVRKTYGPWKGAWTIPSGYVELEESVHATIERELLEESGVTGRAEALVAVRHLVSPDLNDTFLVFRMRYVSGEPRPDGSEVSHAAFVPLRVLAGSDDAAPFTRALIARIPGAPGFRLDAYRPPDERLHHRSYLLFTSGKVQEPGVP